MDDTGGEVASATSMGPYYVDAPTRRQHAEAVLPSPQETASKRRAHQEHGRSQREYVKTIQTLAWRDQKSTIMFKSATVPLGSSGVFDPLVNF